MTFESGCWKVEENYKEKGSKRRGMVKLMIGSRWESYWSKEEERKKM